jgi:hypothetical protein
VRNLDVLFSTPLQAAELARLQDFYARETADIVSKYEAEITLLRAYVVIASLIPSCLIMVCVCVRQ